MKKSSVTLTTGLIFALALMLPFRGETACAASIELEETLKIQEELEDVVARVMPAFVKIGGASGVIISEDGYVLTNYHVAWQVFGRSETTTVMLPGGASYIARRVGWDPVGDVTLCKLDLEEGEKLPYLEFGDSDALEIGQLVITLGNPFNLSSDSIPTVSFGVVSGKNRYVPTSQLGIFHLYGDAIQTDAPLNPGNSGGPMISLDGKLLGLNGLIMSRFSHNSNAGIGYAVSINQIKLFLDLLKHNDVCYHGTISGLQFDMSAQKREPGAHVKSVKRGSTAGDAGFKAGDIITKVNDIESTAPSRFFWMIHKYPEKTEFAVAVKRDGEEMEINVTSERIPWNNSRMPLPKQQKPTKSKPTPAPTRVILGVVFDEDFTGKGVKIQQVMANSGAEKAGIQEGDVIIKIDGIDVTDISAATALLQDKKAGDVAKITLMRGDEELNLNAEMMSQLDMEKKNQAP